MASHRKETTQAPFASLSDHPVAIIGLGSIFPQAENISTYWDNIFNEVDCVTDIPASRWAVDDYYDPNPAAPDKTYSKRGAFIPDIDFNPMEFGLPPNILEVTDVSQLLSLVVAKQALSDAGYLEGPDGLLDRTGVILGMVGIASKVAVSLSARLQFPIWQRALDNVGIQSKEADRVIEKIKAAYIDWNENAFPGALGNIVAGRITNRFNLGGTNCTIDAACGSSLAAFTMAVSELVEGRADMMITGGVDIDNSALTYLCFSKTPALSKNEKVRTFDEKTDGMLPGEGIGMVVLKRLADAKRDGDQIYALIRGIGTSSDGRFKSIYAPRPEGQAKALRRAYEQAGFAPQTVGLIEAHGTGTPAGDPAEFAGLRLVFTNEDQSPPQIALGSVKSQIGHTKAAAGTAGMIKAALALHHKILPATINVDQPNAKFDLDGSLFYINNQTRPWILRDTDDVRRAGVSAFGFGGTNFHIVLEEYAPEHTTAYRMRQGAGMLLLHHPTHAGLIGAAEQMLSTFRAENGDEEFAQQTQTAQNAVVPAADARLAFAAVSPDEAIDFLEISLQFLRGNPDAEQWEHPKGIYFRANALETKGHVVVLFPGQGAQYVNMGKELALQYPAVRQTFAEANHLRAQRGLEPISSSVFPIPVFTQDAQAHQKEDLTRTENAQPAIGTLSVAMYKLLRDAGLKADFFAGHSFGELTALWGAGVYDETAYLSLAIARGQAMGAPADVDADPGTMLAVKGDADAILKAAQSLEDVMVANINSHAQVVLAGSKPAIARAQSALAELGFATVPLSVSAAFHTPLVAHAQKPFATAIRQAKFSTPSVPVFSNNTAQPHAADPTEIQQRLENHILGTVNFREEIRNIHAAGGTIFIEVGPRNILTNLVKNILANETISAVALNPNHRLDSDLQLRQAYLQLKVLGLPLGVLDPFFRAPAPAERPANSKLNVKLNGGVYLSDATKANYEAVLNDGFQIKKEVNVMQTNIQQPQTIPAEPATAPVSANQPPVNGYAAAMHQQYLQTAQEFNKALAALSELEQTLVQTAHLNGNHHHLDTVMQRINRLFEHQETMMQMHRMMLNAPAPLPAMPVPVSTPAPVQPAVAPPVPAVSAAPAVAQPVAPVELTPTTTTRPEVSPPRPTAAPSEPAQTSSTDVEKLLLATVSDKTGYPAETLELSMNMEADLGIDSIKRVEILGAIQEEMPEIDTIDMEALGGLNTLQEVVDFIQELAAQGESKKA